ncbi:unnamed protein product [Orchesella dallaii]|uniref:Uncharacterized protein n=1 Tax=Orchesella dallaii TaxID=48710 RepID=A0ABP1QBI9_9HEXA
MSGSSSSASDSSFHDRKRKRKRRTRSKPRSSKRQRMDRIETKLEDITKIVTSLFGNHSNFSPNDPYMTNTRTLMMTDTPDFPDTLSVEKADEQSEKKTSDCNNAVNLLQLGDEQSQNDLLEITEERERIRKSFCIPPNCVIGAPALNPELKTVNGFTKNRDEEIRRIQGNIATAITGLGQLLTSVVDESKQMDRSQLIAQLSDTGRFLTGTQYQISLFRRKEIKSTIRDSSMIEVLNASPIYPDLFGSDLTAKFKQATSLNKVGHDITKGRETTGKGNSVQPTKF